MKLSKGNIIEVHGFVMLQGLDDGERYQVTVAENGAYWFARLKKNGQPRKFKGYGHVGHHASSVDAMVNFQKSDYNFIKLIS